MDQPGHPGHNAWWGSCQGVINWSSMHLRCRTTAEQCSCNMCMWCPNVQFCADTRHCHVAHRSARLSSTCCSRGQAPSTAYPAARAGWTCLQARAQWGWRPSHAAAERLTLWRWTRCEDLCTTLRRVTPFTCKLLIFRAALRSPFPVPMGRGRAGVRGAPSAKCARISIVEPSITITHYV